MFSQNVLNPIISSENNIDTPTTFQKNRLGCQMVQYTQFVNTYWSGCWVDSLPIDLVGNSFDSHLWFKYIESVKPTKKWNLYSKLKIDFSVVTSTATTTAHDGLLARETVILYLPPYSWPDLLEQYASASGRAHKRTERRTNPIQFHEPTSVNTKGRVYVGWPDHQHF